MPTYDGRGRPVESAHDARRPRSRHRAGRRLRPGPPLTRHDPPHHLKRERGAMTALPDPHAEFPLGPFTPYAEQPDPGARRGTAGSPRASTTRPRSSRTTRWCCSTARTPTTSSRHVGLATSDDGIHFERHPEPVLSPTEDYERVRRRGPAGHRDRRHLLPDLHRLGPHERPAVPGHVDRPVHLDQARADVPGLQHVPAAGQRRGRRRGARPAGSCRADRRPLPHVLRRGLDLLRLVRRPDPLGALPPGRAADGADRARERSASSWSRSARSRSSPTTG